MCGLAFLLAPALAGAERRRRVERAIERLRHRGPDAQMLAEGTDFAAGHTRLAVIDLTGGHQPRSDPSGRWWLVFNGEIYNYRALHAELAGRWDFRDASDTEVLCAGLVLEGERFIARLDGMWAFAFYDAQERSLLLSRDRLGKKPLYYRAHGGAFACASELPALKRLLPEPGWSEDPQGIGDYFRYGFALPGHTCLAGVREVLPAHVLRRARDGRLSEQRYWPPAAEPWRGSFAQAAHEVREYLVQAVRKRQLAADVEVGAFLSGGVDSTAVCALAQKNGFGTLRTFTAGFPEPTYDERAAAARVAARLGTRHHAEELSPAQATELAATLPLHIGQPFGDASLVPSTLVAMVAARHVKVVLTGDGGDELFGGYARYVGRLLLQSYRRAPQLLRRAFERAVLATAEPPAHHSGSLLKRLHLFVRLAREPLPRYVAPPALRAEQLARLVPALPMGHAPPVSPWPADEDELREMMLADWLVYLPQDILQKVDRASMSVSLEARCPFLDRELAEFVVRLPWHWHFRGQRGKRLLRAALAREVPEFVWRRRKQGFSAPLAHWFRSGLGQRLQELAESGDCGVVEPVAVRMLLAEHRSGRHNHDQALWLAYCYLSWRQAERTHG
jgi:asparagine synthase (glutamine-hydrolysing)